MIMSIGKMHTMVVMFGVVANIILIISLLSIIVGAVWTIFPLKNRIYITETLYRDTTPMGGRITGIIMLASGIIGMILGFTLDEYQDKLMRRFGART